ncbi:MAG: hypothetical protein R3E39_02230 [Anaerolineae bacterium]
MQCDVYHPFQILADLMTIQEKWGVIRAARPLTSAMPMPLATRSRFCPAEPHSARPASV